MEAGNIEPARAPPSFQHSPLFVRAACRRRSIRQTIGRRISALAASAPRDRCFHARWRSEILPLYPPQVTTLSFSGHRQSREPERALIPPRHSRDREFGAKPSKPSSASNSRVLAQLSSALVRRGVREGTLRPLHAPASCNFDSVW